MRRSVSEVDGQVVMGQPKSEAGKRTATSPVSFLPALRVHLES